MNWIVEYDNNAEGSEWWTVTDGDRSFTCSDKDDAEWLCDLLWIERTLESVPTNNRESYRIRLALERAKARAEL